MKMNIQKGVIWTKMLCQKAKRQLTLRAWLPFVCLYTLITPVMIKLYKLWAQRKRKINRQSKRKREERVLVFPIPSVINTYYSSSQWMLANCRTTLCHFVWLIFCAHFIRVHFWSPKTCSHIAHTTFLLANTVGLKIK